MNRDNAKAFVEALRGLVQQEINDARRPHEKFALDSFDYEAELVQLLVEDD